MDSLAHRILAGETVPLEHYRYTFGKFFCQIPFAAIAVAMLCGIPAMIIDRVEISVACLLVGSLMFVLLMRDEWKGVGTRDVRIDPQKRRLLIRQAFPNQKRLTDSEVPFSHLLLLRYWQMETDSCSGAFVICLQASKVVRRPDVGGYELHCELESSDPSVAEAATAALAERLVAATGIEYRDLQNSASEPFAQWSNPHVRRTTSLTAGGANAGVGKPTVR